VPVRSSLALVLVAALIAAAGIAPVLLASVASGNQAPPFGFLLGFAWFVAASIVLLRPGHALGRGALAQRTAQ
jgi:hypothetical protein